MPMNDDATIRNQEYANSLLRSIKDQRSLDRLLNRILDQQRQGLDYADHYKRQGEKVAADAMTDPQVLSFVFKKVLETKLHLGPKAADIILNQVVRNATQVINLVSPASAQNGITPSQISKIDSDARILTKLASDYLAKPDKRKLPALSLLDRIARALGWKTSAVQKHEKDEKALQKTVHGLQTGLTELKKLMDHRPLEVSKSPVMFSSESNKKSDLHLIRQDDQASKENRDKARKVGRPLPF